MINRNETRFSPDCSPNLFDELRRDLVDLFPVIVVEEVAPRTGEEVLLEHLDGPKGLHVVMAVQVHEIADVPQVGLKLGDRRAGHSRRRGLGGRGCVGSQWGGAGAGHVAPPPFRDPSASPGMSTLWGAVATRKKPPYMSRLAAPPRGIRPSPRFSSRGQSKSKPGQSRPASHGSEFSNRTSIWPTTPFAGIVG